MLKKYAILIIYLITLVFPVYKVEAVTQGSDEITIIKPTNSVVIRDTFDIEWRMVDADVDQPAYFLDVFNLSCGQAGGNIGRITNSGAIKNGNNYIYSWNTTTSSVGNSLQDQGNYCLRICGIFAEGGSVYSLCDKASFVFSKQQSGTNKVPQIESLKEGLTVALNQSFNYTVKAKDPDGDTLIYSIVSGPDFVNIDSTTGEVTGRPNEVGDIKFIVKVDDGRGGIATEQFILNVIREEVSEIKIIFPVSGSKITPENNEIKWEIQQGVQIKNLIISYSVDKSEWVEITRLDRNTQSYKWNLDDVDNGEYFLRMQLIDLTDKTVEITSGLFEVTDSEVVNSTTISDMNPAQGSVISETRPVISATIMTPEGVTITPENVKFTLNDRIDLTVCEIVDNKLTCEVISELSNGEYKAFIELSDSEGSTVLKEWTFVVNSNITGGDDLRGNFFNDNLIQLILIVIGIGFVLIALPWTLYAIIKRKRSRKDIEPLPINPVVSPTEQLNSIPLATSTQSIIGAQEVNYSKPDLMPTSNVSNNDAVNPITTNEDILNTEITTNTDNTNQQNNSVLNEPALPSQESKEINERTESETKVAEPLITETLQNSASPYTPDSPIIGTQEINETQSMPSIPKTVQPGMYSGEDIPEWLNIKDTPAGPAPVPSNNDEPNINKTDVLEGAKVFDPYGLALSSDDDSTQKHN